MAIVFEDSDDDVAGPGTSLSLSSSVTISATGNERMVIAWFWSRADSISESKVTSVLFDSVAPTGQLTPDIEVSKFAANGFTLACYFWDDGDLPATSGTYACTATTNADDNHTGQVVQAFRGVEQVTPTPLGRNSSTATDTSSDVSVTPPDDGSVVSDAHGRWEVAPPANVSTAGSGQIKVADFQVNNTSFRMASSYEPITTGGSSETQTYSWIGNSEVWMSFALVLAPFVQLTNIQVETGNYTEGDAGGSFNHTLTSSENRIVLVIIDDESTSQATGVTYDGVAMTNIIALTEPAGFGNAGSMWVIREADLPAGPGSFAVVVSGLDAGAGVDVLEINGVNQVIPTGSQIDTDTTTAAVLSLTVSPTVLLNGESVLVGMGANGGPRTYDDPPTGDGTYIRIADHTAPPTSAQMATAFQIFVDESGAKDYTETITPPTTTRLILFAAVFQEFGMEMDNALPTNF